MTRNAQPTKRVSLESAAEWVHVDELRPWEKNPRKNDPAVPKVAESIRRFGFVSPIVVWQGGNRMVAGHTRLKAMRALLKESPGFVAKGAPAPGMVRVAFHEFADEHEADIYALADNRLGEIAEWDDDAVADITRSWSEDDKVAAGFDDDASPDAELGDPDDVPEPPAEGEAVTQRGDLWLLGEHRLLCGDSTEAATFARLMQGERASMCFTDPPYNADYRSRIDGRFAHATQTDGGIANDNLDDGAFAAFIGDALGHMKRHIEVDGAVYVWTDWKRYPLVARIFADVFTQKNLIVWDKTHFGLGKYYRTQHEMLLFGCNGDRVSQWYGEHDERDVWSEARDAANVYVHPTQKPVALPLRAMRNTTKPGAVVLDAFGGSGTTLIACESFDRVARLIEVDPHYCDVIVARWEKFTGKKATRVPASEVAA